MRNQNDDKGLSSNSTNNTNGNQNRSNDQRNAGQQGGQQGGSGNQNPGRGNTGGGGGDGNRFLPIKTGMPVNPSNGKLCAVPDRNARLSESHMWIISCPRFKNLTEKQAYDFYKACHATCRICYSTTHPTSQCGLKFRCLAKFKGGRDKGKVCNGRHHTKLHYEKPGNNSNATSNNTHQGATEGGNQE